jgi:V-type H+-transporting ATPase subunit E
MEDGVKVAEKIFKSRKINECRMKEMKVRFDMIERVQEETKKFLRDRTHDVTAYKALLKKLIKQGLIKLLEEKVELRCLKAD